MTVGEMMEWMRALPADVEVFVGFGQADQARRAGLKPTLRVMHAADESETVLGFVLVAFGGVYFEDLFQEVDPREPPT